MPFAASQEEKRLFINYIIDLFTKHILRTQAMSDILVVLEDLLTNQKEHPPHPPKKLLETYR